MKFLLNICVIIVISLICVLGLLCSTVLSSSVLFVRQQSQKHGKWTLAEAITTMFLASCFTHVKNSLFPILRTKVSVFGI